MRIKRLPWMILITALAAAPLAAQSAPGTSVFAPFVSRLEGERKNNLIRLSWVDSSDVKGPVYIFRSSLPFEGANPLPLAAPVEVPYGTQSFVDEIETGVVRYYFAAASDETGRRYDIPIPFTNTIQISSGTQAAAVPNAAPTVPAAPVVPRETGISGLKAASEGGKVTISFNQGNVKNATLYRSIRPISQTPDLLGAAIVQTNISSPYTDTPVPGIPYYYAVISGEDLVQGTVEILPGRNATTAPAEAFIVRNGSGADSSGRDIRAMPLPEISVQAAIPGTSPQAETPPRAELSPRAEAALGDIPARPQAEPALKKPRVFARDIQASPAAGEEYTLSLIVKGPFTVKNWESAGAELVRFLALPRSPDTSARARFYLGQCRYFLRQTREALFEFLAIQDRYPAESSEWIQATLDIMKE